MRQHRDFLRLVAGQAVSAVGDGISRIAILWWAWQATGSNAIVVFVALATVLPTLAAAPLAGWLVDRYPRRRLMLMADAVRGRPAAASLVVWEGSLNTATVVVVAALAAIAAAVFDPALLSSVTMLVDEERRIPANSLLGGTVAVAGIAGPAIGGVLVGAWGTGAALMADAATFAVSFLFVVISRIPDPEHMVSGASGDDGGWTVGLQLLRSDRGIRDLVMVAAGLNLAVAPIGVLIVSLAAGPLQLGGRGFGLLEASVPLGIVAGFIVAPKVARGRQAALVALLATGAAVALSGAWAVAVWAAIAFMVAGVGVGVTNTVLPSRFQAGVEPAVQGRVFALVGALGSAGRPVGLLAAAPMIALVGIRGSFAVCGSALALVAWAGRRGLAGPAAEPAAVEACVAA